MKGYTNHTKRALQNGEDVCAAWIQGGSAVNAEILAIAGFETLFVDLEHGIGDTTTLHSIVQAMHGYMAIPFVRVPWNDFVFIKRVLDLGVYGILVPYVNNATEAKAAVSAVKYPPLGFRGVAGSTRAAGYGMNISEYLSSANDEICVFVQVETVEAVKNLHEILKIDGLDGIFIGPLDLATNMGYFADPGAKEVRNVIEEVEKKVVASNKFLGTVANSWEEAKTLHERGYQLVISLSDIKVLGKVAMEHVNLFKGNHKGISAPSR